MHSRIDLDQLRHGWQPARIGRRIVWHEEIASTNTAALDAAEEPDADGLVVMADHQSAGRGRLGRRWQSPRGASVLASVLLVSPEDSADTTRACTGRLNMVAAVAACEAICQATDVRPAIKWPNDLRVDGKKLGGILIESRALAGNARAYVVGFGINCLQHAGHFPPELTQLATSLELATSQPVDRTTVARCLLQRLDDRLGRPDWLDDDSLHPQWLSFAEPIGRRISLRYHGADYTGCTVAVDPLGGLTVQLDNGRQQWFDPMLTSVV